MVMTPEHFMPILFKVLFSFVGFNIIINFFLLYIKRRRIYKLLATFWPSVLFVFMMEGTFQVGSLAVTLGYSATLLSVTIISMVGFEAIGRKFPLKQYILYYLPFYPVTLLLNQLGYGFTIVAMPIAIATATPLVHSFIYINIVDKTKTTPMQKMLGLVFLMQGIHCINFALFRMEPGAQLWGWIVAYAIWDMLAILLPSIALEEANMSENDRLNQLVIDRTSELDNSLKVNEKLLSVMMHDISNPLAAMKFYLSRFKPTEINEENELNKIKKSQKIIEDVLTNVREIYKYNLSGEHKDKISLGPVRLDECFNEVNLIFSKPLADKNVTLVFKNQLEQGIKILVDKTSFNHSVLSNLISNALKFSVPGSEIEVVAKEEHGIVVLEVTDKGPGIPSNVVEAVMNKSKSVESSTGTSGEKGLGLGLSIVKSFVDSYGGEIVFESREQVFFPQDHGTSIRITLEKAPTLLS